MCNEACILFIARCLSPELVRGKQVIELGIGPVGAKPLLESWSPAEYVGVDIRPTPFTDLVIPSEKVVETLGGERFDVVLCTEMLEHARDWRLVINNLKRLCKPGGRIVLTTRSLGYRFHAPPDYWRYEVSDIRTIFADCASLLVEPDPLEPGVFAVATRVRPADASFLDLTRVEIYSMILHRRTLEIPGGPGSWLTTEYEMWKARISDVALAVMGTLRGHPPVLRFVRPPTK